MAHVRSQLLAYLKPRLTVCPDATGGLFVRRTYPLGLGMRPVFLLSIDVERSEDISAGGTQERVSSVRVVAVAKGDQEADEETLNRMAVFAETVFSDDPTLGGLASDYQYRSTEFSTGSSGEKVLSAAALTFDVTMTTRRDNPETAL